MGGGARALVRQPKTSVFFAKIAETSQNQAVKVLSLILVMAIGSRLKLTSCLGG